MMDGLAGLWDSPTERVQMQHGKATRFQVRKLYDRFHQELSSHMETGNSQVAAALIRGRQSEVNNVDEAGVSLLMTACRYGDELVVKTLLEYGAMVNAEDNDTWTPLMYACRDGQVQSTVQLLESGANLEKRDLGGWTALMWACYKGRTSCVEELIKREVNVNIKAMYNMTCLHWTAGRGHMECTQMLLAAGAKVDATDKYGSTPLIWASRKGYLPIVDSLISHGASADAVGMYSWTPLLVALQGGHVQVAQVLLESHPNLNATNQAGLTALALAAKGGYSDIVVELLNQGAYLNIADKNGDTVLHHAVKGGHVEIVKMLLRKNPDIDAKGQDDKTVLYTAADKGSTALVKLLLSADPDKELSDKDGNTPLLRAVRNRNCEIAFLLIEKGAKVSAADMKGDTCLHIAMRARNRRMLELLLKNPSNSRYLYMRNDCGETPYSIDGTNKRSLLSHIFGSRSLNSQVAVESQLGYELYSSSLADILSSPRLNTPMTVGLFAKWGSGKSFMLNKLKEDMLAYMKQSPQVFFEFSWLVFFINCGIAAVVGLLLTGLTKSWEASLAAGAGMLIFCYVIEAMLYCLERKKRWDWLAFVSNTLAIQLQRLRLILYMFFYNRPPPRDNDFTSNSISFVFAESTKLTSLGGEQSLASMIGSLFDALETRYGVLVTRLYKVFGSDKEENGRFKKLCCIPYFVIFLLVIVCLVTAAGLALMHIPAKDGYQPEHIVALVVGGVVGVFLLLSLHNVARAIAVYCHSPKRRATKASQSLNSSKSDNFMHVLKKEVELLSSLVTTMDRHEAWQTRLVLIVDGLDSCEQDKVLQVLDAINLIIPENSPFIVLLAVDPHVIIKGIEANQLQALRDQSLNGYGYLRNIVHLPFYLQNHGLPRMYTANESAHFRRWQNVSSKQKLHQEVSVVSSTISLDQSQRGSQKSKNTAADMFMMEPLHQFIGEMPKNIMKNDYFVDINPRSMRRLMNIIAMAGRLLRANDIEFNWYRLSAWINITEQWPYRTSWILLYYEEMEGKLEDSLSLMSIYELVKERIPVMRDADPLLDIDRNEKKFVAFLKSHVPKMNVDDIKKFMPATINLDPFLRKLIKEKARDTEVMVTDSAVPVGNRSSGFQNQRLMASSPTKYGGIAGSTYPTRLTPLATPVGTFSPLRKQNLPKDIKPLSKNTVEDVCELLHKIKGMSSLHIDEYKAAILLHNVNGLVLSECNMSELRPILDMKFGDWQLFQLTILAMRETDVASLSTSSSEEMVADRSPRAPLTKIASVDENSEANVSANCLIDSPLSSRKSSTSLAVVGGRRRTDTSLDMVMLENQMIMGAIQNQVPSSDEDEESSDDDEQDTVRDVTSFSTQLGRMKTSETSTSEPRNVKFEIVDESGGADPLILIRDVPQLTQSAIELRSYNKQTL